jgi:hypothetical protein
MATGSRKLVVPAPIANSAGLAVESIASRISESSSMPAEERPEIRAPASSAAEEMSIGRLPTMQISPGEVLVNLDVVVDPSVVDRLEARIRIAQPETTRSFVELEQLG